MTFITYKPSRTGAATTFALSPATATGLSVVAVLIVCALALLFLPSFPSGRYAQDLTAILNGGYRISRGHLPHVDFVVPFGSLTLLQGWVAQALEAKFSPVVVLLTSSFLLIAPFLTIIGARQPDLGRAMALVALTALITLVPFVVEYEPVIEFNFNAFYNRNASALCLLGLVWLFGPKRATWRESLFLAALLALMLWWKASHAAVFVGVACLAALVAPPLRRIVAGAAILLAPAVIGIDLLSGGFARAYAADIAEMIRINAGSTGAFLLTMAMRNLPALAAATLALLILIRSRPLPDLSNLMRRPIAALRAQRPAFLTVLTCIAVLGIESQNIGHLGLFPALALGFGPLAPHLRHPARAVAATLVLCLCAYPYAEGALRRAATLATRHSDMRLDEAATAALSRTLVSSRLSAQAEAYTRLWRQPETRNTAIAGAVATFAHGQNPTEPAAGLAWAREVAAMAELARASQLITPQMRIMTVGYVEPFARILGAEPVPGGRLWLDPQRTLGRLDERGAARMLEPADVVFVQLCPKLPALEAMVDGAFSRPLRQSFRLSARTPCYEMWTRP